jgi:serine/threonine-protein kinase
VSDGSFYYVMELLEGMDLDAFVEQYGPQSAARTVHLLRQVCASLAEAHAKGLVHRDIKPRNLMLCRLGYSFDFMKVLDFGLVKIGRGEIDTKLTMNGVTTGTPAYMAPEIALGGENVDARADIYALGCVAYWLLTGRLVFESGSAVEMALAHVRETPVPPSQRTELPVPGALDRVILACLEKDPHKRPQTVRDLDRMLAACDSGDSWTAEHAEQWWRRHLPSASLTPVMLEAAA